MDENQVHSSAIEILNRFGLPTALLVVGSYFIYSDIIKPIAGNYQELLVEVKLSNTEIRQQLMTQADDNRDRIDDIEKTILKNSEMMGANIENIAEQNHAELMLIAEEVKRLLSER